MKAKLITALLGAGMVLGMSSSTASAHVIAGTPAPTCTGVSATFSSFPGGTNTITAKVGTHTAIQSFTGTSGMVSYPWTSLSVNTATGGTVTYSFSWTVDGGGTAGPYAYNAASCAPPPTTTTIPVTPPVTTTVPAAPTVTTQPPATVVTTIPPATVKKPVHHTTPKPAAVKVPTPAPVKIPEVHTGEYWSSPLYLYVSGFIGLLGIGLLGLSRKPRRA